MISQVVLSFGIPFALIPLVIFTSRRDVMGGLVNHRVTTAVAVVVATAISALNIFLLAQTFGAHLRKAAEAAPSRNRSAVVRRRLMRK